MPGPGAPRQGRDVPQPLHRFCQWFIWTSTYVAVIAGRWLTSVTTVLVVELPELERLNGRENAAWGGVASLNWDSGQYQG